MVPPVSPVPSCACLCHCRIVPGPLLPTRATGPRGPCPAPAAHCTPLLCTPAPHCSTPPCVAQLHPTTVHPRTPLLHPIAVPLHPTAPPPAPHCCTPLLHPPAHYCCTLCTPALHTPPTPLLHPLHRFLPPHGPGPGCGCSGVQWGAVGRRWRGLTGCRGRSALGAAGGFGLRRGQGQGPGQGGPRSPPGPALRPARLQREHGDGHPAPRDPRDPQGGGVGMVEWHGGGSSTGWHGGHGGHCTGGGGGSLAQGCVGGVPRVGGSPAWGFPSLPSWPLRGSRTAGGSRLHTSSAPCAVFACRPRPCNHICIKPHLFALRHRLCCLICIQTPPPGPYLHLGHTSRELSCTGPASPA